MDKKKFNKIKIPTSPGVYIFKNKKNKTLYIGKAGSLKDRVKSYFTNRLLFDRGERLVKAVEETDKIELVETDSVLEATILEANLIKKYQPFYNVKEKDNKSFLFVVITKEDFPRVIIERGRNIKDLKDYKYVFGPFTDTTSLKEILKIIRGIFPFRDKCKLNSTKPCFMRQIGLCPGTCTGEITKKDYAKIVRDIVLFFKGEKNKVVKNLEKEMNFLVKKQDFEKAITIRNRLAHIRNIRDINLIKKDYVEENTTIIESYDISHMFLKNRVGVMCVLKDGEFQKDKYRTFNIKTEKKGDTDALKEILKRRFMHTEWELPKLIVVDGGKQQLNAAKKTLTDMGIYIPIVSVKKDERHKAKEILGDDDITSTFEKSIIKINNESHRFSVAVHSRKRFKLK